MNQNVPTPVFFGHFRLESVGALTFYFSKKHILYFLYLQNIYFRPIQGPGWAHPGPLGPYWGHTWGPTGDMGDFGKNKSQRPHWVQAQKHRFGNVLVHKLINVSVIRSGHENFHTNSVRSFTPWTPQNMVER